MPDQPSDPSREPPPRHGEALERLVEVMARLRGEGGCPWDREQDLRSLRPYLVEEAYEVLDEMDRVAYGGPWRSLCEELGDLLFQIVFHAQLASERSEFTMADVCRAISEKIVSRHPHVFAEARVAGAEAVMQNWAKLKAEEKRRRHGSEGSVLDGVPSAAPALMRAERLTEKASRIGFDWPDLAGVRSKLDEELRELDEAVAGGDRDELEHELGDVLFALSNLARFIKTPPEDALRQANRRFTERFHQVEAGLRARGVPFGKATLEEMDELWVRAKERERAQPRARKLPRTELRGLLLASADLPATARFFERLAPLLRWSVRGEPGEVRVDAAGVRLRYRPGPVSPLEVELEAPSPADVEALHAELVSLGLGAPTPPADLPEGGRSLTFQDPDGHRFRYLWGR